MDWNFVIYIDSAFWEPEEEVFVIWAEVFEMARPPDALADGLMLCASIAWLAGFMW